MMRQYNQSLTKAAELRTGGLSASMHVQEEMGDLGKVTQGVLLSSHCLDRYAFLSS